MLAGADMQTKGPINRIPVKLVNIDINTIEDFQLKSQLCMQDNGM